MLKLLRNCNIISLSHGTIVKKSDYTCCLFLKQIHCWELAFRIYKQVYQLSNTERIVQKRCSPLIITYPSSGSPTLNNRPTIKIRIETKYITTFEWYMYIGAVVYVVHNGYWFKKAANQKGPYQKGRKPKRTYKSNVL